ncbi:MAG: bifunctional UDP-N-acetylglucosamine diphosphorylase/glucosamine-1-phosphate N-acetyltransferase GlmU [Planctomycetota bacterium]
MALAAIILAAGKGVRMHSPLPKVIHPVCGRPMVCHVIEAVKGLDAGKVVVVVGSGRERVEACVGDAGVEIAVQEEPRGTADAVRAGLPRIGGSESTVLVVPGDTPLVTASSLKRLVEARERAGWAGAVLTFVPPSAGRYGRVIRGEDGRVARIVEAKDATADELAVGEVNSGMYCFRLDALRDALPRVGAENAAGEFYLTDVVGLLAAEGVGAVDVEDPQEVLGINTPQELAEASSAMRQRLLAGLMARGVTVVDPSTTCVEVDVEVGEGTEILPFTFLHRGVRVGRNCRVGPFSHLREGAVVADGVWIGAFVELKQTRLGEGSTAGHLAYLGDAEIGKNVTVGGGVITANYDGREKHRTVVGDGAVLGSGTALVAPVTVGPGAVTGAGAVVTRGKDVEPGDTVVGVPARSLKGDRESRGAET